MQGRIHTPPAGEAWARSCTHTNTCVRLLLFRGHAKIDARNASKPSGLELRRCLQTDHMQNCLQAQPGNSLGLVARARRRRVARAPRRSRDGGRRRRIVDRGSLRRRVVWARAAGSGPATARKKPPLARAQRTRRGVGRAGCSEVFSCAPCTARHWRRGFSCRVVGGHKSCRSVDPAFSARPSTKGSAEDGASRQPTRTLGLEAGAAGEAPRRMRKSPYARGRMRSRNRLASGGDMLRYVGRSHRARGDASTADGRRCCLQDLIAGH